MKKHHVFSRCCRNLAILLVAAAIIPGCGSENDDRSLPIANEQISEGGIYAEVVVPAGQSDNSGSKGEFLPYPGNWAVIRTSPVMDDSLNTLILSDALSKGSVLQITPVALLQLGNSGSSVDVIISVPVDTALQTVVIGGLVDLLTEHEPVRHILQTWFVNHHGFGSFELRGWRDEQAAVRLISQ